MAMTGKIVQPRSGNNDNVRTGKAINLWFRISGDDCLEDARLSHSGPHILKAPLNCWPRQWTGPSGQNGQMARRSLLASWVRGHNSVDSSVIHVCFLDLQH